MYACYSRGEPWSRVGRDQKVTTARGSRDYMMAAKEANGPTPAKALPEKPEI